MDVPARVGVAQGVVEAVGIAVVVLRVGGVLEEGVGAQEALQAWGVGAPVHVDEAQGGQVLVAGVAALAEHADAMPLGQRSPVQRVARPPPGVERLPRYGLPIGIGEQRPRALEVGVYVADRCALRAAIALYHSRHSHGGLHPQTVGAAVGARVDVHLGIAHVVADERNLPVLNMFGHGALSARVERIAHPAARGAVCCQQMGIGVVVQFHLGHGAARAQLVAGAHPAQLLGGGVVAGAIALCVSYLCCAVVVRMSAPYTRVTYAHAPALKGSKRLLRVICGASKHGAKVGNLCQKSMISKQNTYVYIISCL